MAVIRKKRRKKKNITKASSGVKRSRKSAKKQDQIVLEDDAQLSDKMPENWAYQDMTSLDLQKFLTQQKPATWGDALSIIHDWRNNEEFDKLEKAGVGNSNFMTNLLWHISTYGPTESITYPA